jgi:hypothetical protein
MNFPAMCSTGCRHSIDCARQAAGLRKDIVRGASLARGRSCCERLPRFFPGDFCTFFPCFRKANRDRLFPVRYLTAFSRFSGPKAAVFLASHGASNGLAGGLAILSARSLSRRTSFFCRHVSSLGVEVDPISFLSPINCRPIWRYQAAACLFVDTLEEGRGESVPLVAHDNFCCAKVSHASSISLRSMTYSAL